MSAEAIPAGPYGLTEQLYKAAGWPGSIPLPLGAKWPPPKGFTGADGDFPSVADALAWREGPEGAGNIGLRLPDGIIGLDVDNYDGKAGAATLAEAERRNGPLPPTWRVTARTDGVSGIRFYRTPLGLAWPGELGPGVEIIQFRHRYAVAAPSIHPNGATYQRIGPDGHVTTAIPRPDDLPLLPPAWVQDLSGGQLATTTMRAGLDKGQASEWLATHGQGEPCRVVAAYLGRARDGLLTSANGSRHDAALRATRCLAAMAAEGHTGVSHALDEFHDVWLAEVEGDPARTTDPGEWARIEGGAIDQAAAEASGMLPIGNRPDDPCVAPFAGLLPPEVWPAIPSKSDPEDPIDRTFRVETPSASESPTTPAVLPIRAFADLAAEVDSRGPRKWLIRGLWPQGDYGVHGAEPKAGKTWNALDLAVSVASGTPWLGCIPVDTTGPVIVFAGEGGQGNIVRRIRAIAASRGLDADTLPLHICTLAPHLNDPAHLAEMAARIDEIRPVLVTLDPLYLSARGASGTDLYAMGAMLEGPQRICQAAGAALLVVTHYNRSRDLTGAARLTGAGPAEWGRVLIAAAVVSRHTDPITRATTVLISLDVTGGEVPDQTLRIVRVIGADDPDDLDSPLRYSVTMPDAADSTPSAGVTMRPAAAKLLAAVTAAEIPVTARVLVDWIASEYGHGLTRETVSRELNALAELTLVDYVEAAPGKEKLWHLPVPSGPVR